MTAGARHRPFRAHRPDLRATAAAMHGMQAWVALPDRGRGDRPRPSTTTTATDLPTYRGRRPVGPADRRRGLRRQGRREDPLAAVLCPLGAGGRRHGRACRPTIPSAPPMSPRARSRSTATTFDAGQMAVFAPGDPAAVTALEPRHRDAARRRAGRPALHLVELRLLPQGAHRAGQGRLEGRPHEAARPPTTTSSSPCRERPARRRREPDGCPRGAAPRPLRGRIRPLPAIVSCESFSFAAIGGDRR